MYSRCNDNPSPIPLTLFMALSMVWVHSHSQSHAFPRMYKLFIGPLGIGLLVVPSMSQPSHTVHKYSSCSFTLYFNPVGRKHATMQIVTYTPAECGNMRRVSLISLLNHDSLAFGFPSRSHTDGWRLSKLLIVHENGVTIIARLFVYCCVAKRQFSRNFIGSHNFCVSFLAQNSLIYWLASLSVPVTDLLGSLSVTP